MSLVDDLHRARVIAVLRRPDISQVSVALYRQLHEQGVRAIECTLDQPGAVEAIQAIKKVASSDMLVGAGTVTTTEQLDSVASIGVRFAMAPHLDPDLLQHASDLGIPLIPGVTTPSEIARAFSLGAPAVKLFPAGPLGIPYFKALRGPFGDFAVIPTGGIQVSEVGAWLEAGALCVGLGNALTGPDGVPNSLESLLTTGQ